MSQAVGEIASPFQKNPFGDARANSRYAAWSRGRLVHPLEPARTPTPLMTRVHDSFRAHMLAPEFSCVGGKAALNNNPYRFGLYAEMGAEATTTGLAHDLWEYVRERPSFGTEYATYVASFAAPVV